MANISQTYKRNINGVIFTLAFHIIVLIVLNVSQFQVKQVFEEPEILIDFTALLPPEQLENIEKKSQEQLPDQPTNRTNIASSKLENQKNEKIDRDLQQEMEQARQLTKNVSQQLSREIPTIDDLRMPIETSDGLDPDSLMRKLYTGDSNIEYFLENRYHVQLPKPIYLAFSGGKVEVSITVDRQGRVLDANPIVKPGLSDQVLSYAKTAALRTRFNASSQAPQRQQGKIIYTFIPQ